MTVVYVAGKTHDWQRVRKVHGWIRSLGGTISYDWTVDVERIGPEHEIEPLTHEQAQELAIKDRAGVANCDLLIALAHPLVTGTLWELGMAAAWMKPTVMVGDFRYTVFADLPNVLTPLPDDNALLAVLPNLLR